VYHKNIDDNDINQVNQVNHDINLTLEEISSGINEGETLILDVSDNHFSQMDKIFDTLIMRGYDVRKSFFKGRNQIVVSRKRS